MTVLSRSVEYQPAAYGEQTVDDTAVALIDIVAAPTNANGAFITLSSSTRIRFDGTAPTTSVGLLFPAGLHIFENQMPILNAMQVVRDDTTDTEVGVHWFLR